MSDQVTVTGERDDGEEPDAAPAAADPPPARPPGEELTGTSRFARLPGIVAGAATRVGGVARRGRSIVVRGGRAVLALGHRIRTHPFVRHPRTRRVLLLLGRGTVLVLIAAVGGWIGAALAPPTTAYVGPLTAEIRVVPSVHPGVRLLLPPAGRVEFDTHSGPLSIQAQVSEVDLEGAKDLIDSPAGLMALERSGPEALRSAVIHASVVMLLCALLGAVVLSLLWYRRRWLRTLEVAGAMLALVVGLGAVTGLTFDADRFASPRFTGLLSQAPYVAGSATSLADRLESYRSGLADVVQGVTSLYATAGQLPGGPLTSSADVTTLLHVSDIHLNPLAFDLIDRLVEQFDVDAVIDTGDIVTWGTPVESRTLSRIEDVGVPYVFVRGNHDSAVTQAAVATNPNAVVLDGDVAEVAGVTIAGIGDPKFTPDETQNLDPSEAAVVESQGITPGEPQGDGQGGGLAQSPDPERVSPGAGATEGANGAGEAPDGDAGDDAGGADAADGDADAQAGAEPADGADPLETSAGQRLADVITGWDDEHAQQPVQIAAVHEPAAQGPLLGRVPLILSGHLHQRSVTLDPSGTLVMIQGSTGGAGITANGLRSLSDGDPVPVTATLIYVARTGARAGRVIAYDEVTMGGFGLTSVTLQRHVVRPEDEKPLTPPEAVTDPSVTPTAAAEEGTPSGTPAATSAAGSPAAVETTSRPRQSP